jgi:flagellar biosynthetic protein FliS
VQGDHRGRADRRRGPQGLARQRGRRQLAENLRALYGYLALRLTHANLHNDAAALDECQALIEPVRAAWAAIAPAAPRAEVQ